MNYISSEDAVFVQAPESAEAKRIRVKPGDVLLTITGSKIGRVAPVPSDMGTAYISQHVALIRLGNDIDPRYVSMYMSLPMGGQREIERLQYGQTKPGLNLTQIQNFCVPFPPPEQQHRFFEVVNRYDRLRAQQREALRQAEHLFQTLLQRAFSGAL